MTIVLYMYRVSLKFVKNTFNFIFNYNNKNTTIEKFDF